MAAKFWVGGNGTWDLSTTTNWATSSGGAGGAAVPAGSDTVTFDGNSGAGTGLGGGALVTVNGNITLTGGVSLGVTGGNFIGTVDFATNNNNVSFASFSFTGSGTRQLNLGSGTLTLSGANIVWDFTTVTGLTFNKGTGTISLALTGTKAQAVFNGGGQTFYNLSIGPNGSKSDYLITGANTFNAISVTAPAWIVFSQSTTQTISTAFTWTGSSSNPISITSGNPVLSATISVASGTPTIVYGFLQNMTFTGGATFSATSSYDLFNNTGITITQPAGGSGSHIIGS